MRWLLWVWLVAGAAPLAEAPEAFIASLEETMDEGIDGVEPAGAPPADVDRVTRDITLGLRCPVCQGLSAADSTSPAAINMQRRVRELVSQGYSQEQIEAWFVTRYDQWVLLSPRNEGYNRIVWLGPAGALLIGLTIALSGLARRRDPDADTPPSATPPTSDDPYARALLAEAEETQP